MGPKLPFINLILLEFLLTHLFLWNLVNGLPRFYKQYRQPIDMLRKRLAEEYTPLVNPEENRGVKNVHLVDGDIFVHVDTRDYAPQTDHEGLSFGQNYAPNLPLKKNAVKNRNWVWTKRVVPFVIDANYDSDGELREQLYLAMEEFHSQTCVRFRPRVNEVDYINIAPLDGCYSAVGRQGSRQNLSLAEGCRTKGTIMHELMHSLGFWHEQSRMDRDDYVTIDWNNIIDVHKTNFQKYPSTKQSTFGAPYDYASILHYKANAFAKDKTNPTIIPKSNDPIALLEMGQRKRLSPVDVYKINAVYHCNISRCDDPGLPENGFRQGSSYDVGATMTYSCRQGFTLIGSSQRYCMDNGEWTAYLPECVAGKVNYCDFEDPNLCGWVQDNTDETEWYRHQASTQSEHTGPNDDHTLQTTEGHYLYLEASTPTRAGNRARLISPVIRPFAKRMCIRFYYSMYGQGMGSLKVFTREIGQTDQELFSISGDKGQGWQEANIPLKPTGEFKIVIEGTRGSSYLSDMAIDDVILADCNAMDENIINLPEGPSNNLSKTFHCDFDKDMCGFVQDKTDKLDFFHHAGPTLTSNTGPDCDHTSCKGRYVYFETSSPRTPGDNARIISPELHGTGIKCGTFFYSMYGGTMGTLDLYLRERHSSSLIWSKTGDQGPGWQKAQVEFQPVGPFTITYEAKRGPGYHGDIGIDDMDVTDGPCFNLLPSNDTAGTDDSVIGRLNCDFELDYCGWQHYLGDHFDWVRNHGSTITASTGPIGDHTPGRNGNGMYIYVESSAPQRPGNRARIESPILPVDGDGYCLKFWYHMIGQHIGALRVIVAPVNEHNIISWERTSQQVPAGFNHTISYNNTALRDMWLEGTTHIRSPNAPFRIYFEGEVGNSYRGDIALDDVSLRESTRATCT